MNLPAIVSGAPVRVLIVDDSAFYRAQLARIIGAEPDLQVVGEASNGREAIDLAGQLNPDLITMDVEMPVLDGIEATREIMRSVPTRIVMLSAFTAAGAEATLNALDAGAVDFITKRALHGDMAGAAGQALRARLRSIASSRAVVAPPRSGPTVAATAPAAQSPPPGEAPSRFDASTVLVIGASTGGPALLGELVSAFQADFQPAVVLAVHMPAQFTACFSERLARRCRLPLGHGFNGARVRGGQILVAPGGMQSVLRRDADGVRLEVEPGGATELYRPSIDRLLESAALAVGRHAAGVVLTGMGSDGSVGARAVKAAGGLVWAQDEASSTVFGMPAAVIRAGLADEILSATELASRLRRGD